MSDQEESPVIELRAADVSYASGAPWRRRRLRAVRSVSLAVAPSETLGLVGESGSGKTSVGRLCLGFLLPTSGQVLFRGRALDRNPRRRRGQLQVVLQHPEWALNPRLRIGSSVAEPLVITGHTDRRENQSRVQQMLGSVGLSPAVASRYPHELSGGQRQRVAIARALITDPEFVVFDEAVSALDVSVQAQILNLIVDLQARKGFAALFISHDLAAVRYVSHRIAVMFAGEIVEIAPKASFYGRTLHPYSMALRLSIGDIEASGFEMKPLDEGVAGTGCPLHLRCPMALDICRNKKPSLRSFGNELTACHRSEELAPAAHGPDENPVDVRPNNATPMGEQLKPAI